MAFPFLVTVFIKIVNSAVCVGLYYGLLTTFSIRPSFFLLLVQEPEKRVAVITGLILAQLVRFLSIYNAPLHRLLCIPHAITTLFVPYVTIYWFFDNFHPEFSISTSSTFSFFLNSFIFQLSNQIIFPSSLFARVGHIYLFRSNNKLDFLTGNFVGWAIGQMVLFLFFQRLFAWIYKYRFRGAQKRLVSEWKKSITKYLGEAFPAFLDQRVSEFWQYYTKYSTKIYQFLAKHLGREFTDIVRDCEWFVAEVQYFVLVEIMRNPDRALTILGYIIWCIYAGVRPRATRLDTNAVRVEPDLLRTQRERAYELIGLGNHPINKTIKKKLQFKEWHATRLKDSEVDRDVDLNEVENRWAQLFSLEKLIEELAMTFFEPSRWERPLRYIRNHVFTAVVREQASQYFFDTCRSDGKERIAFTYLPPLSVFKAMMKRARLSSSTVETSSFDELDKNWIHHNKEKKKNLNNELKTRIEALDAGFLFRDILEKRTRVCTDKTEKTCLPTEYDPLLNGPRRGKIKELALHLIKPQVGPTLIETIKGKEPITETSDPDHPPGNPFPNFTQSDSIQNAFSKRDNDRRRNLKIVSRLYSKYLESQAKRRKKNQPSKSRGRTKVSTSKSRGRTKVSTSKSRGRKILGPSQPSRNLWDINGIIDTLLPGYLPQSQKYELTTHGLVIRKERTQQAKIKFDSNPLLKLFQIKFDSNPLLKLFQIKFDSNPLLKLFHVKRDGRVDWEEQQNNVDWEEQQNNVDWEEQQNNKEKLMQLKEEELWNESGKKVPRWTFLLVSDMERELKVTSPIIPAKPEEAGKDNEENFEITDWIYSLDYLGSLERKKKKKNQINQEEDDNKIDENTDDDDNEIDENTEKADNKIAEKTKEADNKIDENTEKADNKIAEKTKEADNKIAEKTKEADNKIAENTKKADNEINAKTKTKKKTAEEIEKEREQEIIKTYQIRKKKNIKKKEKDRIWLDMSSKARQDDDYEDTIRGSALDLMRKDISLRWIDPFDHSPLFYNFIKSRIDMYFKVSAAKVFVKKWIDRFKRKISKIGPRVALNAPNKKKRKKREKGKERKKREKGKERKKREKGKERKIDEKERKERKEREKRNKRKQREKEKERKIAEKERKERKKREKREKSNESEKEEKSQSKKSPLGASDQEDALWHGMFIWDESIDNGIVIRTVLLLCQSVLRKKVMLPLLIILKNSVRFILLQKTEWAEDFEELENEVHQITTHSGIALIGGIPWKFWPEDWSDDGFQIIVVKPFYLKPWHYEDAETAARARELIIDYGVLYLMPAGWGLAQYPFGLAVNQGYLEYFFLPIWNELKPILNPILKPIGDKFLISLRRSPLDFKVIKKFLNTTITRIKLLIGGLRKTSKQTGKRVMKDESSETKKEKDSRISNEIIEESFLAKAEEQIQDLIDRTNTIKKKIERIRKEKGKVTPGLNKNGESSKNFWKIFKRRKVRLRNKFHYFRKCLLDQISEICLDIVLCIINKILEKDIIERNKKRLPFTKDFLKLLAPPDLSSLSQAYVFYKLAQRQVSDKLRSVLEYRGTSLFLKTAIKESFERQGIFHSELKNEKLRNFRTNPWKNWLRGLPHYTLSKSRWSQLKARVKEKKLLKYLKSLNYFNRHRPKKKKQNVESLKKKTNKLEKNYRYDLLASKFLSSETNKDSYISKQKEELCGLSEGMFMKYYLNSTTGPGTEPLESKICNIFEIDFLAGLDSYWNDNYLKENPNAEIWMEPYPSITTIPKGFVSLIPKLIVVPPEEVRDTNPFFDWMEMNEKSDPIVNSNNEDWFVRHVLEPMETYSQLPWLMPSQQLVKNLEGNSKMVAEPESEIVEKAYQKEKKNKQIIQQQLAFDLPIKESDDPQEIFFTGQELFINEYKKRLRELRDPPQEIHTTTFRPLPYLTLDYEQILYNEALVRRIRFRDFFFTHEGWEDLVLTGLYDERMTVDNLILSNFCVERAERWLDKGLLKFTLLSNPVIQNQEELIMYQVISTSLHHKRKLETKENFDLLVPEMILSSRRRRELRILNSLNFNRNRNGVDINRVFSKENNIKSSGQFLDESKDLDRDKNEFIKLKFFLWPNFRLEDLACMNRYWFDTSNGSRFSMLRIYMYPRFKLRSWYIFPIYSVP